MKKPKSAPENPIVACWRRHLVVSTGVLLLLYVIVFQWHFATTGDTWAEGFTEYLTQAIGSHDWREVFSPGWAGYLTILPSFLSKVYVAAHLPLGQVDYFFRFAAASFALASSCFVAGRWNRQVIRNDSLRVLLALLLVVLPHDVATFSFINIWYIGFVPLMFIGLNPQRLPWPKQVAYVLFGSIVMLSKPAVGIIPFVLYRAYKTKEYVSNGLLMAVILVQTGFLIFAPAGGAREHVSAGLGSAAAVIGGAGVEVMKLVQLGYTPFWIAFTVLLLAAAAVWLWRAKGLLVAAVVVSGFLVSVYGHVLPPGESVYAGRSPLRSLYNYPFKPQREFLIYLFLVVWLFLLLPSLLAWLRRSIPHLRQWRALVVVIIVCAGLIALVYQPIDMSVAADLTPYRQGLQTGQSLCIPLPVPSPHRPDVHWVFQQNGGCAIGNDQLVPNDNAMNISLLMPRALQITSPDSDHALKSVLLRVRVPYRQQPVITLHDETSNVSFYARARASASGLTFVSFNVAGLPKQMQYQFVLSASQQTYVGYFKTAPEIAAYPYFIGGPSADF